MRDESGRYEDVWAVNGDEVELARLTALAEELDEATDRRIRALDPRPDWRCLEIGAGTGSIARLLARTCPQGHVVAADIDLRFLRDTDGIEVVRHDITVDDFPDKTFDLIHTRHVFIHLAARQRLIAKVARWLAPGGRLLVEEAARFPFESSPHATFRKVSLAVMDLSQWRMGTDTHWPRTFPEPLRAAGLVDLGFDVTMSAVGGDSPMSRFWSGTVQRFAADLVASGRATDAEVDAVLKSLAAQDFHDFGMATMAAWGRRPATA